MIDRKIILWIVSVLSAIHLSDSLRRISEGDVVKTDKRYVVYFVKAKESPEKYNAWLCGGAIVSEWYIITSAACVEDVTYMYAIAGYKLSVNTAELDTNECTKQVKKKVVYTCVPKAYELVYDKIEKWSNIDIAVAKVDSPYQLSVDAGPPLNGCSYAPTSIKINYEPKYQEPGIDVIVLGWGHLTIWRNQEDFENYNQKELRYAATIIHNKEDCIKKYSRISGYGEIISKYMICTSGPGNLDDGGDIIDDKTPTAEGCSRRNPLQYANPKCVELMDDTRRNMSQFTNFSMTRRQGICQNDHGGPLVTWVGSKEVLLGVAAVFRVLHTSEKSLCEGPYLYTSTQCNGAFLDCVLNQDKEGPADNEEIKMRPQIPINQYNPGYI